MILLDVGGQVVVLGLHVGEAVDAGDDHGGVLAQAVQNDAQGLGAHLVGVQGDLDGALGGSEGLVACQEGEALGLLLQKPRAQVAVADADLALVRDGAGDAERLQAHANAARGLGGGLDALLHGDGGAQLIGPLRVLEADGLR